MTDQPLTVQLAEAFGSKPVRKSLLTLIDELIDLNLEGQHADRFEQQLVIAQRAEEIHQEIERRLAEVDNFHDPESVRIRAILESGEDKPWFE